MLKYFLAIVENTHISVYIPEVSKLMFPVIHDTLQEQKTGLLCAGINRAEQAAFLSSVLFTICLPHLAAT